MLPGRRHDRREALQAFIDRAIDIALGKRLGRSGKHRHFLNASRQRVLKPAQVRRQRTISHTGLALDLRKYLGGTGHLRHPLGRDKTADLDIAQAGSAEGVHQMDLVRHADGLGFVLQTIARADFHQAHV